MARIHPAEHLLGSVLACISVDDSWASKQSLVLQPHLERQQLDASACYLRETSCSFAGCAGRAITPALWEPLKPKSDSLACVSNADPHPTNERTPCRASCGIYSYNRRRTVEPHEHHAQAASDQRAPHLLWLVSAPPL